MYTKFYHGTTRKMMVAFSSVFDNINIDVNGKEITVPLHYANGEKFIQKINRYADLDKSVKPIALPVMGYELTSMQYEPERHTNFNSKIMDRKLNNEMSYMYNKCPISWNFDLFIATKRITDGLQIIEQIIPFFQPHLNLTMKGVDVLERPDNVQLILTSFSHEIGTDGSMDEVRYIMFQLSFMMKGFLYTDVRRRNTIQEAITRIKDLTDSESETIFAELSSKVLDYNENNVNVENNIK